MTENAPEMTACEAITAAAVASTIIGISSVAGTIMNKRIAGRASGLAISSAPCPK